MLEKNAQDTKSGAGQYFTPRALIQAMVDVMAPEPGETIADPACGTGGFLTCALRHMRDRYVKKPEDERKMQAALRAVEKKQLPHMLCVTNMLLHGIEDPSFVRHDNTLARPYISWGQSDRVDIVLTNPPFGTARGGGGDPSGRFRSGGEPSGSPLLGPGASSRGANETGAFGGRRGR